MTQGETVTAKSEELKRLFSMLSEDGRDKALCVLNALVFAQATMTGGTPPKESA